MSKHNTNVLGKKRSKHTHTHTHTHIHIYTHRLPFNEISNAPVEISCPSIMLAMKKHKMQAYIWKGSDIKFTNSRQKQSPSQASHLMRLQKPNAAGVVIFLMFAVGYFDNIISGSFLVWSRRGLVECQPHDITKFTCAHSHL